MEFDVPVLQETMTQGGMLETSQETEKYWLDWWYKGKPTTESGSFNHGGPTRKASHGN